MSKAEKNLLERARHQYGLIEPCAGRTLRQCFFYQNGWLQFWFNDSAGNTHLVSVEAKEDRLRRLRPGRTALLSGIS
jgi:hypothetical protein